MNTPITRYLYPLGTFSSADVRLTHTTDVHVRRRRRRRRDKFSTTTISFSIGSSPTPFVHSSQCSRRVQSYFARPSSSRTSSSSREPRPPEKPTTRCRPVSQKISRRVLVPLKRANASSRPNEKNGRIKIRLFFLEQKEQ